MKKIEILGGNLVIPFYIKCSFEMFFVALIRFYSNFPPPVCFKSDRSDEDQRRGRSRGGRGRGRKVSPSSNNKIVLMCKTH